jgi:hypothetical protein
MCFFRNLLGHFVRVEHLFLRDQFGGHGGQGVVFLFESDTAFFGCGVHAEDGSLFLVTMGE